jgi:hypothetical protein
MVAELRVLVWRLVLVRHQLLLLGWELKRLVFAL